MFATPQADELCRDFGGHTYTFDQCEYRLEYKNTPLLTNAVMHGLSKSRSQGAGAHKSMSDMKVWMMDDSRPVGVPFEAWRGCCAGPTV